MTTGHGGFERIVQFEPGYNYLHETGPKARGQHGMQIRFVLRGQEGATQFLMFTGWTPLGEIDKDITSQNGYHPEPVHCDNWRLSDIGPWKTKFGFVPAPTGADLGYHWSTPTYDSDYLSERECDILPGGKCYYDGSGLRAEHLLKEFIDHGDDAVWTALRDEYTLRKSEADEHSAAQALTNPNNGD